MNGRDETTGNPLLDAALAYAARGWRVVPLHSVDVRGCSCSSADCKSPGKHPRTKHGLSDGTTDAEQVRRWWGTWPRSNVGVVCGPESGVWMVGPDGERGLADLKALEAANTPLPPTATNRSGSGGMHFLFRYPADGRPIRNRKNLHGTRIDVRAHGGGPGYFVAPPSVNENGRYEVVDGREPADAPAWLLAWAERDEVKERPVDPPTRVVGPPVPQDRKSVHQRAALYLDRCTPAVAGQRGHDALFWAARAVVWGFKLPEHEALGLLASFYNPRCQPEWSQKELLHKVREAATRPFDKEKGWLLAEADPVAACPPPSFPVERKSEATAVAAVEPWKVRPSRNDCPVIMTAKELAATVFPEPKWAVDGLLPEGLTVLAGDPKAGKSWLSLLLGSAVAGGGQLDGRNVTPGEVLYLALEDPFRRLQWRQSALQSGVAYGINERLSFSTRWPRMDAGGLYHIAEWLEARKGSARLVIVDTLAMFRRVQTGKGNGYAEDYEAISGFKQLVDFYGVCGLVVHHTRKVKGEDPFADLSGTQGLTGAADTIWVLDAQRGSSEGRLYMTGRDVASGTVPMTFEKANQLWRLGPTVDGIDTTGRGGPIGPKAGNLIDGCLSWLRQFLAEFAFPSREIEAAGKAAGFAFPTLKEAKSQLSNRTGGPLHARKVAGEWWNGLGTPDEWKLRPSPAGQEWKSGRVEDRTPPRRDTGDGAGPDDGF